MNELRLGVIPDFREENWPSMDLVADMLLREIGAERVEHARAESLCPRFKKRFMRTPIFGARGTAFQHAVWDQLRKIRVGTTISYGEMARRVGRPTASRAVGMANATNPIALIVPCHRVIRTGGALGGYGFGLDYKRWLLDHERAGAGGPATLFHRNARDDRRADAVEDVVEAVTRDRQPVIA